MRRLLLSFLLVLLLIGCASINKNNDLSGSYYLQKTPRMFQALFEDNYSKIEFQSEGTFILYKAPITFTPVIEQCDYASKGKWSVVANNIIEITSENYYIKEKGFEYEIKKENKFSQDSLYIQIVFPNDFHHGKLNFVFNNNNGKSITTDKTFIVLPKSKYLWNRKIKTNLIDFSINVEMSGMTLYKSRIWFDIFKESINTEQFNYLTITLPYFDICFVEFEPYFYDLIYIKDNQIFWQGDVWSKD